MKYYKTQDQVFAFELDGSQDEFITKEMVAMTKEEVDRHINPQKYWTEEQKEQHRLSLFKPLTRRQFKLVLLENGLLSKVEDEINNIPDEQQRMRVLIEYTEASKFERSNPSVIYMVSLLKLSSSDVDRLWEQAEKL